MNGFSSGRDEENTGLIWKLPVLKTKELGKLGPGFGIGAGCGIGFAIGLIGGSGIGPVLPGLGLGMGFGAGCGIGVGFGYGLGRGVAYDRLRRYSNVGKFSGSSIRTIPSQDEIAALVDDLIMNTKKLVIATSKEVEKWRRQ